MIVHDYVESPVHTYENNAEAIKLKLIISVTLDCPTTVGEGVVHD